MNESSNLIQLYRELNKQFWKGRLPEYKVVVREMHWGGRGECQNEKRRILLAKRLRGDELRQVLLHEMCHIGCPHHGRKFQAKLARLAEQGEAWAIDEAEQYRVGQSWNQQISQMRDGLFEIAMQDRPPTFRKLVAYLARDFGKPPSEFMRYVPWLKAAWKNTRREAKKFKQTRRKAIERMRGTR